MSKSKWFIVFLLVMGGVTLLGGAAVYADCSNNFPVNGETVTCTGGDDDPADANNTQETNSVGTGAEDNVTVNVDATGSIRTGGDGVDLNNDATVNNSGNINRNGEDGVDFLTGTVNNNVTGNINNNTDDGVDIDGNGTVNNSGNINRNGESGVDSDNDATVNNNATGTITNNGEAGVDILNDGTVNNYGNINRNGWEGVYIGNDGTVNNYGNINNNADEGVHIDDDGTVTNTGDINRNGLEGIYINDNGTVINSGRINNNGSAGIAVFNGTVTNTGSANGNFGPGITMFDGTIINSGTTNGNCCAGMMIDNLGTVINNGSSDGNIGAGILVFNGAVINNGSVNGNISGPGIDVFSGNITNNGVVSNNEFEGVISGNGTIVNNGEISGNDAGGANLQVYFCGCSNFPDTFIQGQTGRVIGALNDIAIEMGDGDDNVFIDIRSEVVGVIEGNTHVNGDRLVFTISSADPTELAEFAQFMAGVSILDNTLTYKGRTFDWINFEELATIIQNLAQEAASSDGGGDAEGFCGNGAIGTFRLPNRDLTVMSGFGIVPPNGFVVGIISMEGLQNGLREFRDSNTLNPGWVVRANQKQVGVWTASVFDDRGNFIGACDFLFTLNERR